MTQTHRATVSESVQIGVEDESGVAVPAVRRLPSLTIEVSPDLSITKHEATGSKALALATLDKEFSKGKLAGPQTYTELAYVLAGVVGNHTTAAAPGGATRHAFHSNTHGSDTFDTFTVEQGSTAHAHRAAGLTIDELTLTWSRSAGTSTLAGTCWGQPIEDGVALTGTSVQTVSVGGGTPTSGTFTLHSGPASTGPLPFDALAGTVEDALNNLPGVGPVVVSGGPLPGSQLTVTAAGQQILNLTAVTSFDAGVVSVGTAAGLASVRSVAQIPLLAQHVSLFLDSTPGALGTTQYPETHALDVKIGPRFLPVWTLDNSRTGYAATVEQKGTAVLGFTVEADAQGMGLLANARVGTRLYARIVATGPLVAGTTDHNQLVVDLPVQVSAVKQMSDAAGVYAIGYELTACGDDALPHIGAVLTNGLAAL